MAPTQADEQAIFEAVRRLDSGASRDACLDEMCGDDHALKQRVIALLGAYEESESFLESPIAAADSPSRYSGEGLGEGQLTLNASPISESPGDTIGPYKLLQQIGEGGMGVVFMAEQTEPIQRTVALKIIKPGMDTRQVIARFEAERQALAMMDHPNIAKVLDAGTTGGGAGGLGLGAREQTSSPQSPAPRPFFVMELVKGVPITKYCDDHKLSLRERLELFKPVCETVQHAHQKGIIHRDLKPTNVLVAEYDNHAVPKVIDFGVAKATAQKLTERTMFTEFGQVIGTVEYMSPEQAKLNQLDIDTRSDIYSLGVLLYELLTGSTPFDRERLRTAAFDEVLRIIREEEPPKPSTRLNQIARPSRPGSPHIAQPSQPGSSAVPDPAGTAGLYDSATIAANRHTEPTRLTKDVSGELDWIVMKCLEKDRNRRYETANGLASDIERYLNDEAVQACPPSTAYRFRKFARRNKSALLVASGIVATLVVSVIGLTISNRLITAERNEKVKALSEREQALALAEAEGARAERNFLHARIAIRKVLTGVVLGKGKWSQLSPELRKKFGEEAIKFHETFLQDDSPQPALRYETAVGYRSIALVHSALRDHAKAEDAYRKSIAMLERLVAEQPASHEYRHQLAYASSEFSRAEPFSQRPEAETFLRRAAELYEKLLTEQPDSYDFAFELAMTLRYSLAPQVTANRIQEAEGAYHRAIELLVRLAKEKAAANPDPSFHNRGGAHEQIGQVHLQWGYSMDDAGRPHDAVTAFLESAAIFDELRRKDPNYAWNWDFMGHALCRAAISSMAQGQYLEANKYIDQIVEISEEVSRKLPDSHASDYLRAQNYSGAAFHLATAPQPQHRNPTRALDLANKAVKIDPKKRISWITLGIAQYRVGDWQAAIESLKKSMALHDGGDGFEWCFLAMCHWQLGHKEEARRWYDKGITWVIEDPEDVEQITRFRAEATELLDIVEPQSKVNAEPKNNESPTPTEN